MPLKDIAKNYEKNQTVEPAVSGLDKRDNHSVDSAYKWCVETSLSTHQQASGASVANLNKKRQ